MKLLILLLISICAFVRHAVAQSDKLARGKYLVEEVGRCQECHTPKTADGQFDREKWMKGTVLNFQPIEPIKAWHKTSPDLTRVGRLWQKWGELTLIKFLTTGAGPNGKPADPPMPTYKMKQDDADRRLFEILEVKHALLLLCAIPALLAQNAANTLVVVNDSSLVSRRIAGYYVGKRSIPLANVSHLKVSSDEGISREVYDKAIETPIAAYLTAHGLREQILYIVTTLGLPLRVDGAGASDWDTTTCAVDSELTLLYAKMRGEKFKASGPLTNPFFGKRTAPFRHPKFPIYLVARLAGYDFEDVKGIIDRSLQAANRGRFVIDLSGNDNEPGNNWLREAARLLPADRVVLDTSAKVLYDQRDVIGYAGWGSNDHNRKRRLLGFQWLPGAIATEFVSTDGRTFQRPPDSWNITTWRDKEHFFANSPQSLTADYIHEGASGCSGHVIEPFLWGNPRPNLLLPAYVSGRNLAESYYVAIPALSWQNIVVGDPLCRIGNP